MTWPCKLPLWTAALALLAACATSVPLPPPPQAPQPLAPLALSAADIRQAEQHAYWQGYAAGRRYQAQQDAQNTPDAPSPAQVSMPDAPAPVVPGAPAPAVTPPAAAPLRPMPPPVDSYSPKGPAQPVATPLN